MGCARRRLAGVYTKSMVGGRSFNAVFQTCGARRVPAGKCIADELNKTLSSSSYQDANDFDGEPAPDQRMRDGGIRLHADRNIRQRGAFSSCLCRPSLIAGMQAYIHNQNEAMLHFK